MKSKPVFIYNVFIRGNLGPLQILGGIINISLFCFYDTTTYYDLDTDVPN